MIVFTIHSTRGSSVSGVPIWATGVRVMRPDTGEWLDPSEPGGSKWLPAGDPPTDLWPATLVQQKFGPRADATQLKGATAMPGVHYGEIPAKVDPGVTLIISGHLVPGQKGMQPQDAQAIIAGPQTVTAASPQEIGPIPGQLSISAVFVPDKG